MSAPQDDRTVLEPAAAVVLGTVDGDLNLVRVDAIAHPVAALAVDDVHVDPRRLINLAGKADDRLRLRLHDRLAFRADEGQVLVVDDQVPEGLGPKPMIG